MGSAIANYRMAEAGHLHTNLVLAARSSVSSTSECVDLNAPVDSE